MGRKKAVKGVAVAASGQAGQVRVYYLVNPGGAIHAVSRELAAALLREPGYRQATKEEIEELKSRDGHQTADNPICAPWDPEPVEVEDETLADV